MTASSASFSFNLQHLLNYNTKECAVMYKKDICVLFLCQFDVLPVVKKCIFYFVNFVISY